MKVAHKLYHSSEARRHHPPNHHEDSVTKTYNTYRTKKSPTKPPFNCIAHEAQFLPFSY